MAQSLYIAQGNGITFTPNTSASLYYIAVNTATASQVTTGSLSNYYVSASALSQSDYGKRSVYIPLNTYVPLNGTETNVVRIPSPLNGWKLISAMASCSASSTSGSPTFTIYRSSASSITQVNMLSTNVTIDQGEYDSLYASASTVVSSSNVVYTGDKVWVSSAGSALCGTGVLYSGVSLTFQNLF